MVFADLGFLNHDGDYHDGCSHHYDHNCVSCSFAIAQSHPYIHQTDSTTTTTPVTTETTTSTETACAIVFYLQAQSSNNNYLFQASAFGGDDYIEAIDDQEVDATQLALYPTSGQLSIAWNGEIASINYSGAPLIFVFNTPAQIQADKLVEAVCAISNKHMLTCNDDGDTGFFLDNEDNLNISQEGYAVNNVIPWASYLCLLEPLWQASSALHRIQFSRNDVRSNMRLMASQASSIVVSAHAAGVIRFLRLLLIVQACE